LQAAAHHATVAYFDPETARLVLSGRGSHYSLISQNRWAVTGALEKWARAQRKNKTLKDASPAERKAAKLDAEIAKLQRRKAKVYAERPVNPLCQAPREMQGDYLRDREAAWHEGKRVRQELSRVFTAPCLTAVRHIARPDWKSVYAEAARVLGVERIDEARRHSRVTKLTRGPSLTEYVRHPETHLAFQRKPWRDAKPETFDVERMRERRKEYLEELSVIRAIEQEIRNLERIKRAALRRGESELLAA
jgi:hypothetical protein